MYDRSKSVVPSARELVVSYLTKLEEALASQASINEAVHARQTLIIDPATSGDNRATLNDIADQIDDRTGNRKEDATFAYHGGERALEEMDRYVSTDNSDWEKIAFVAAYFQAGSSIQLDMNFSISSTKRQQKEVQEQMKLAGKMISEIQWKVADELRTSLGFTEPKGYTVKNAVLNWLEDTKYYPEELAKEVSKVAVFKTKLEGLRDKLVDHRKHLKEKIGKGKTENLEIKKSLVDDAITAIGKYDIDRDLTNLSSTISALVKRDEERTRVGWWKHPTSSLVGELKTLINTELGVAKESPKASL